jgi:hypothetical protein
MTRSSRTIGPLHLGLVLLLVAGCGHDSQSPEPEPERSLVGRWDVIGLQLGRIEAVVTTGTWVFREDGTYSVNLYVELPDGPIDQLIEDGDYVSDGKTVAFRGSDFHWQLIWDGDMVILHNGQPMPDTTTITLLRLVDVPPGP